MTPDEPDYWQAPKPQPLDDWAEISEPYPPGIPPPTPGVWTWYLVYCIFMAVVGGLLVALGIFMAIIGPDLPREQGDLDALGVRIVGAGYAVVGLLAVTFFLTGVLAPRRPWTWVYGIVAICLGMLNCCTMVPAIVLIIYWVRPENQAYFSRRRI